MQHHNQENQVPSCDMFLAYADTIGAVITEDLMLVFTHILPVSPFCNIETSDLYILNE
jgi:hypothetical protein